MSPTPYSYGFYPLTGSALLTMTSANCSRQALLPGKEEFLSHHVPAASTPQVPCSFELHLVWQTYPSSNASCISRSSGRCFASGYAFGATSCARNFHPLDHAHAGRTRLLAEGAELSAEGARFFSGKAAKKIAAIRATQ